MCPLRERHVEDGAADAAVAVFEWMNGFEPTHAKGFKGKRRGK